jgi:cytochrome c556
MVRRRDDFGSTNSQLEIDYMKRKLLSACMAVVLGTGAGYASMVLAQQKPEVLVKQRQAAMTLIGKYWGPVNGMAQGKVPFNADAADRNADFLAALAQMPWDAFHASTKDTSEKTRALPAIYENEAKFKEYADSLMKSTAKLAAAPKGDEAAFKAAAGEVGKSCGGCHKEFRAK